MKLTKSWTLVVLGMSALFSPAANAAIIGSVTVQNITTSADTSLVQNSGTYVSAANIGNANNGTTTINGVAFLPTASGSYFEGPSNTSGTFRYVSGTAAGSGVYGTGSGFGTPYVAAFAPLLDSTNYNSAQEAVVNLNPLLTYRLQILAGDDRTAQNVNQGYQIDSGSFTGSGIGTYTSNNDSLTTFAVNNLGGAGSETGFVATVTFTGYSAVDVKQTGGAQQGFISGMSLFQAPEPSGILVIATGAIGLLGRRARRK